METISRTNPLIAPHFLMPWDNPAGRWDFPGSEEVPQLLK